MSASDPNWLYFVVWNADGSPRLIVRRNAVPSPSLSGHASWGPVIQLLTRDEGWIDRPELLTRFHDADYLEQVTFEQACAAVEASGSGWPDPEDPDPSFPSPKRSGPGCNPGREQ